MGWFRGYGDLLAQITSEVPGARLRVARTASSELMALSWRIGRLIRQYGRIASRGVRA